MPLYETITDLKSGAHRLRVRRYGVIETSATQLVSISLRPWPHLVSWPEFMLTGPKWRPRGPVDRCRLYYHQPRGHSRFLALKYVACTRGTSYATFRRSLEVLDHIAEIKRSDALLCDASNERISERLLERLGWVAHAQMRGHRNYIKRFEWGSQLSALSYQLDTSVLSPPVLADS